MAGPVVARGTLYARMAWIVSEFGEPSDGLKQHENAAAPEPGPHQVKIKVEVAGLSLPDILMCRNKYPLVPHL